MMREPTKQELVCVGKYVKAVNPDHVTCMKRDGYKTDNQSVGQYVYEADPEMYDQIVREEYLHW